jgi:hypothetical protein
VVVVGPVCEFDSPPKKRPKHFLPRIQSSGFWPHVVHGPPKDPKGSRRIRIGPRRTVPVSSPLGIGMLKWFPVVYCIGRFCNRFGSFKTLSMNLGSGSGLRSRIRRKTRHVTGRPMDARPDPDHRLPDLRPRSTPRSIPGPRRAPAWRHRGVGFSGGRVLAGARVLSGKHRVLTRAPILYAGAGSCSSVLQWALR